MFIEDKMDNLIQFKTFLTIEKGQGERTILTNIKLAKRLLSELEVLTPETVSPFIYKMVQEKKAPSYIKQYIIVIKHWGECFQLESLQDYHFPKKLRIDRDPFIKGTFTDEEVNAFLALPNPHLTEGVFKKRYEMWVLFYYILFYHGMRTIEVAKLRVNDVDFGRNVIMTFSKVKEVRLIPISPMVRKMLREYINNLEGVYLFPAYHSSSKGKGIDYVQQNDWNYFFKNQIKRLGIKRDNLTPYSARHTYGTRQADEDVGIEKIGEIMGHKKVQTTMKYVHMSIKRLQKVQDNDRLVEMHKTAVEQIKQLYEIQHELEKRFIKKVHSLISISEDGSKLVVEFNVRR